MHPANDLLTPAHTSALAPLSNTLTESEALHAAVAQVAAHTVTATAASPQSAVASAASQPPAAAAAAAVAASSEQQDAVAAALPTVATAAAACPPSDSDEPMAAVPAPATDIQPQQHTAPALHHSVTAPTDTPHGLGIPSTPEEDDFIAMLSEVGQSAAAASNTPPASSKAFSTGLVTGQGADCMHAMSVYVRSLHVAC